MFVRDNKDLRMARVNHIDREGGEHARTRKKRGGEINEKEEKKIQRGRENESRKGWERETERDGERRRETERDGERKTKRERSYVFSELHRLWNLLPLK